jgi:hypothetical protein
MQENKRYHFVYCQDDQDKQLWIDADGFARAYDKFWSILDGEDNIDKIEVEVHTLKCIEDTPEVYEWVPDGVI